MELVYEVSEENLKVLVAALHCLAQIGKELSLECDGTSQLTLRALNDAHSASGAIAFDRSFFADVRVVGVRATPFARCKVFARSCCNLFRTLKHVRGLQLSVALRREEEEEEAEDGELDLDCEELRWRLRCDFGVTKTHRMKVHASPIMRAVFHREACGSRVVARQFHWASMLAHLHHSNEVAVTCSDAHVKLESYVPTAGDGTMRVSLSLGVSVSKGLMEGPTGGRQSAFTHRDGGRKRRVPGVCTRAGRHRRRDLGAAHLLPERSPRTSRSSSSPSSSASCWVGISVECEVEMMMTRRRC
ncbi:hypothetical protein PINS_up005886 [Pythium insidiosum]|nr:hypothetical protein PINS_up005886 [Pythium insidiosum]